METFHIRCLIESLTGADYAGLSKEAAREKAQNELVFVNFVDQEKAAMLASRKGDPIPVFVVTAEEKEKFPGGIPGFPNKIRDEYFDQAWSAARGS